MSEQLNERKMVEYIRLRADRLNDFHCYSCKHMETCQVFGDAVGIMQSWKRHNKTIEILIKNCSEYRDRHKGKEKEEKRMLSPVVAALILIIITVVVSIVVAWWLWAINRLI